MFYRLHYQQKYYLYENHICDTDTDKSLHQSQLKNNAIQYFYIITIRYSSQKDPIACGVGYLDHLFGDLNKTFKQNIQPSFFYMPFNPLMVYEMSS